MPVVDDLWWERGITLEQFIAAATSNKVFWESTLRLATVSDEARARALAISTRRRLIAIVEDWCGDAVNTIPLVQRLVDVNPLLEMRVLRRDENDALMDAHLSATARAIPVLMILDDNGNHYGWWGSRPSELQLWRLREGNALPKEDRYKATRTWYARDRGRTTMDEILRLLERSVM
jgi:hypothetical protein